MKATLFFALIVSVIPLFLGLTYIISTRHRLAGLRERCTTGADVDQARADYDAARRAFPASLVARMFGFGPAGSQPHDAEASAR